MRDCSLIYSSALLFCDVCKFFHSTSCLLFRSHSFFISIFCFIIFIFLYCSFHTILQNLSLCRVLPLLQQQYCNWARKCCLGWFGGCCWRFHGMLAIFLRTHFKFEQIRVLTKFKLLPNCPRKFRLESREMIWDIQYIFYASRVS